MFQESLKAFKGIGHFQLLSPHFQNWAGFADALQVALQIEAGLHIKVYTVSLCFAMACMFFEESLQVAFSVQSSGAPICSVLWCLQAPWIEGEG